MPVYKQMVFIKFVQVPLVQFPNQNVIQANQYGLHVQVDAQTPNIYNLDMHTLDNFTNRQ